MAIAFVGGGAAIVGIPENRQIQDIALRIYEQQGRVIAAIWHGTEGIKNLKLSDGTFLIQGKVLTSSPMRFLTRNRLYIRLIHFRQKAASSATAESMIRLLEQ